MRISATKNLKTDANLFSDKCSSNNEGALSRNTRMAERRRFVSLIISVCRNGAIGRSALISLLSGLWLKLRVCKFGKRNSVPTSLHSDKLFHAKSA